MTIAVPNIVSTLDRNKKETYLQDAQRMIAAAEYKIRSDVKIEYPDSNGIVVITLDKLNRSGVTDSPYDTFYSKTKSFVAIIKNASNEYVYYAHLISCSDSACQNLDPDSVGQNRGIFLASIADMKSVDRFDLVLKGAAVDLSDPADLQTTLKNQLNKTAVIIY